MKTSLRQLATQPLRYFRHFQAIVTFMVFMVWVSMENIVVDSIVGEGAQHKAGVREK